MSYQLEWHSTGEVLGLDLRNKLSMDEMKLINQQTTGILDESDRNLILLIDASSLTAAYTTVDQLRLTQSYRDHPKLDAIIVIANTKLNRLITMLAFHLSRARVIQFDSKEQAEIYIANRGIARRTLIN